MVATGGEIYTANYYTSELVSMDLNGKNVQKQVLGAPLAFTKVGKGDMYFHDATICFKIGKAVQPAIRMMHVWTGLTGIC